MPNDGQPMDMDAHHHHHHHQGPERNQNLDHDNTNQSHGTDGRNGEILDEVISIFISIRF